FSFEATARPSLLLGSMPRTAFSTTRSGRDSIASPRERDLSPPGKPEGRECRTRSRLVDEIATLSALITMTKSPVSAWGANCGLCLPRRMLATWTASRPSTTSVASTTYQARVTSPGLGVYVDTGDTSVCLVGCRPAGRPPPPRRPVVTRGGGPPPHDQDGTDASGQDYRPRAAGSKSRPRASP